MKITKQLLLSLCLNYSKVYRNDGAVLYIDLNNTRYLIQATGDLYNYRTHGNITRFTSTDELKKFIDKSYSYLQ